jgi:hypothetical protein
MSDKFIGFMTIGIIILLLIISYALGAGQGRQKGRCSVICDNISNVAVCESGITVCKTGEVTWRKQGQY